MKAFPDRHPLTPGTGCGVVQVVRRIGGRKSQPGVAPGSLFAARLMAWLRVKIKNSHLLRMARRTCGKQVLAECCARGCKSFRSWSTKGSASCPVSLGGVRNGCQGCSVSAQICRVTVISAGWPVLSAGSQPIGL
jgi:hypothetical protein